MIRERSVTEILDASFGIARRRFAPLAAIALVYGSFPNSLYEFALASEGVSDLSVSEVAVWSGLGLILVSAIGFLGSIAVAQLLLDDSMGKVNTMGSVLARPIPFFISAIVLSLILYVGCALGLVLLIIPGIYVFLAWILLPQVVAVENVSILVALRRSWDLMRGEKLRALVLCLALLLPMIVVLSVFELILAPGHLGVVAEALTVFIIALIGDTAFFLLYSDIRSRREGFDIDQLATQVERSA